ncbi:hypothetical protein [Chondromyces crocatus]|uniref:Uncharacterized protein n=1 Tax=Chondromyces crocatus TaxID=52 RepID=A0A0K1ELK2_CHOCO|nr:hypothetical protein [Chondromyces crocatus]AKT41552.1 uncharacterized protein CMC5_057590 [Chondromyces crocatus]
MRIHAIPWLLLGIAAFAGCNAITGLGDLDFNREPAGVGGDDSTSSAGGSTSSAGGSGGEGGGTVVEEPDPDLLWAKHFGDEAEDYPVGVAYAPNGDIVLGGTFSGTMDLGGGPLQSAGLQNDAFIARFSPEGAPRFVRVIHDDDLGQDCVVDLAVSATGQTVALVGTGASARCMAANRRNEIDMSRGFLFSGLTRFRLLVLDEAGTVTQTIPICNSCSADTVGPFSVAVDPQGNLYVGGGFTGNLSVGSASVNASGEEDAFVAKFTSAGNPVWLRRFGGNGNSFAVMTDLVVDGSGGLVITGIWGGLIRIGQNQYNSNFPASFIARLNDNGAPSWNRVFQKTWMGATPRLALASDGVLMGGDFVDSVDFGGGPLQTLAQDGDDSDLYLAKFSMGGAHVWSRRYGDAPAPLQREQGATSIAVEADGNILLGGVFGGTIDVGGTVLRAAGRRDAFVARLDATGAYVSHRQIRGTTTETLQGDVVVAANGQGNVAVTGAFIGDVDYGHGQPFRSQAQNDGRNDGILVLYKQPFYNEPAE